MTLCPNCGHELPAPPVQPTGRPREAPAGQRAWYFAFTPHGWRRCNADFINPEGVVGKVFAPSLSSAKANLKAGLFTVHKAIHAISA